MEAKEKIHNPDGLFSSQMTIKRGSDTGDMQECQFGGFGHRCCPLSQNWIGYDAR